MLPLFKNRGHWLSVHALCRANPLRTSGWVRGSSPGDGSTSGIIYTGAEKLEYNFEDVTVAVIMNDGSYYNTLSSLANIHYPNYRVLFVSRTLDDYEKYAGHVASYGHVVPLAGTFRPKEELSIGEAVIAALQNIETTYVCLMFNGDMLHPAAIAKAVAALKRTKKSYCTSVGFVLNGDGWVTPSDIVRSDTQLMFFKKDDAIRHLADAPAIDHSRAILWHLLHNFASQKVELLELLYFHYVASFTKYGEDNEAYRDSPYA